MQEKEPEGGWPFPDVQDWGALDAEPGPLQSPIFYCDEFSDPLLMPARVGVMAGGDPLTPVDRPYVEWVNRIARVIDRCSRGELIGFGCWSGGQLRQFPQDWWSWGQVHIIREWINTWDRVPEIKRHDVTIDFVGGHLIVNVPPLPFSSPAYHMPSRLEFEVGGHRIKVRNTRIYRAEWVTREAQADPYDDLPDELKKLTFRGGKGKVWDWLKRHWREIEVGRRGHSSLADRISQETGLDRETTRSYISKRNELGTFVDQLQSFRKSKLG